eukprot:gene18742-biopygen9976
MEYLVGHNSLLYCECTVSCVVLIFFAQHADTRAAAPRLPPSFTAARGGVLNRSGEGTALPSARAEAAFLPECSIAGPSCHPPAHRYRFVPPSRRPLSLSRAQCAPALALAPTRCCWGKRLRARPGLGLGNPPS